MSTTGRAGAIAACAAAALLVAPAVASAHRPLFFETPDGTPVALGPLPDGTVSYAAYGRLAGRGDTRVLRARLAKGAMLRVEVLIPDRAPESTAPLRRSAVVTVTGPGYRARIPAVAGARFTEPITATAYLRRGALDARAPRAGVYSVRVTARAPGRVSVVIGTREAFGAADIAALPVAIARVKAWYRQDAPPKG